MEKQNLLLFFSACFFLRHLSEIKGVRGSSSPRHNSSHGIYGFEPRRLFVFGDSYADTGNNEKSAGASWKVPYGLTYPGQPSGRYSDGRVLTDFLAKYLGMQSPLPYTQREKKQKLKSEGMNFAYGGTGVFDTLVIDPNMTTQIDFFQNLINESVYTKSDLQSSLALVTAAGNDYLAYLSLLGSIQDLPTFITRVVNQLAVNLKRIHDMGVGKVAVTSLQPLGCLPGITAWTSYQGCNETANNEVILHNRLLQQAVAMLNDDSDDSGAFVVLDLYSSFNSVLNPNGENKLESMNFETPLKPCCMGTTGDYYCGNVNANGEKMYTVCDDPKAAFFWDIVHPTQAGWGAVFSALKSNFGQS